MATTGLMLGDQGHASWAGFRNQREHDEECGSRTHHGKDDDRAGCSCSDLRGPQIYRER
jgi:hypothetical protein